MSLRPYQRKALDLLYTWFRGHPEGNPVICMPGGSGKSHVIAALVKDAVKRYPGTRVLMCVHSRELVRQNAAKLRAAWPNAPLGVYSAGLRRRDLDQPITFAGIQSIRRHAAEVGHIDLMIVDEAHAISTRAEGTYREFIAELLEINPAMRVIGFTASPYRLGQGMITDGSEALFADIIEPVTIRELVDDGYLAPLRSKMTDATLSTDGIHRRGGEYIAREMQDRFNTESANEAIVCETLARAADRRHWLFFCAGVEHAEAMAEALRAHGVSATNVSAKMPTAERDRRLAAFESGEVRAMCNVGILTTGWDFPDLDCIVFARATQSPGLYLQMAVRGMRLKSHADDCIVLDFAGNVARHGPVTNIEPPSVNRGDGDASVKTCPDCGEVVFAGLRTCPSCGHEFDMQSSRERMHLHDDDIMGDEPFEMAVTRWVWDVRTSRKRGVDMLRCRYYGALSDPVVTEYLCLMHTGYAQHKAARTLQSIASGCGLSLDQFGAQSELKDLADALNDATSPAEVEYTADGKFFRVMRRRWGEG